MALTSRSTARSSAVSRSVRDGRSAAESRNARASRSIPMRGTARSRSTTAYRPQGGRTVGEINRTVRERERDARRAESMQRAARASRRPLMVVGIVAAAVLVILLSVFLMSRTDLFLVEEVKFTGADHLTASEANALVDRKSVV